MEQSSDYLEKILFELISQFESEVVEFKEAKTNYSFDDIGRYFSAISNEANLKQKQYGWLIFGVTNKKEIIGTEYRKTERSLDSLKKEIADQMSERLTFIDIHELNISIDSRPKRVILFQVPAAIPSIPTSWKGHYYGRDGESLVPLNIYEIEQIRSQGNYDWSKQIIDNVKIEHLDKEAILAARENYKKKNINKKSLVDEIDKLDDISFLNKIKMTIDGKVTRAAFLLLGKEDYDYLFDDIAPQITWTLYDSKGNVKDYDHFHIPFLLAVDKVNNKIRNLRYRYMADQTTLFPFEVDQYDQQLMREALHNSIAHQDYSLRGRINVQEFEDKVTIINEGSFIPGSIENILKPGYAPPLYRNPFLANGMVNINMIDTVAMGIRTMFTIQKNRYFPMPDYDLSNRNRVSVTIYGKILDTNYTRLLFNNEALNLKTIFLLDKVQKRNRISKEDADMLRKEGLIEGRYPNVFVSYKVAEIVDGKAQYIKNKGLDDDYYKKLIIEYLKKTGSAPRKELDHLLEDKLPDVLSEKQKIDKIRNLLYEMKTKDQTVDTIGPNKKNTEWIIRK